MEYERKRSIEIQLLKVGDFDRLPHLDRQQPLRTVLNFEHDGSAAFGHSPKSLA
jgi:hypothetical protein